MAGSIYKAWWGKLTAAWYQLSKEEQESLLAKVSEAREKAGGKLPISRRSRNIQSYLMS
jgi:hypothetical protein